MLIAGEGRLSCQNWHDRGRSSAAEGRRPCQFWHGPPASACYQHPRSIPLTSHNFINSYRLSDLAIYEWPGFLPDDMQAPFCAFADEVRGSDAPRVGDQCLTATRQRNIDSARDQAAVRP